MPGLLQRSVHSIAAHHTRLFLLITKQANKIINCILSGAGVFVFRFFFDSKSFLLLFFPLFFCFPAGGLRKKNACGTNFEIGTRASPKPAPGSGHGKKRKKRRVSRVARLGDSAVQSPESSAPFPVFKTTAWASPARSPDPFSLSRSVSAARLAGRGDRGLPACPTP